MHIPNPTFGHEEQSHLPIAHKRTLEGECWPSPPPSPSKPTAPSKRQFVRSISAGSPRSILKALGEGLFHSSRGSIEPAEFQRKVLQEHAERQRRWTKFLEAYEYAQRTRELHACPMPRGMQRALEDDILDQVGGGALGLTGIDPRSRTPDSAVMQAHLDHFSRRPVGDPSSSIESRLLHSSHNDTTHRPRSSRPVRLEIVAKSANRSSRPTIRSEDFVRAYFADGGPKPGEMLAAALRGMPKRKACRDRDAFARHLWGWGAKSPHGKLHRETRSPVKRSMSQKLSGDIHLSSQSRVEFSYPTRGTLTLAQAVLLSPLEPEVPRATLIKFAPQSHPRRSDTPARYDEETSVSLRSLSPPLVVVRALASRRHSRSRDPLAPRNDHNCIQHAFPLEYTSQPHSQSPGSRRSSKPRISSPLVS